LAQIFTLATPLRVNAAGEPYANALLYFYKAGSLTDQDVFQDAACTVEHSQPVAADSAGLFPVIYLNPNADSDYRYILKTSAGALIDDIDDVPRALLNQSQIGQILFARTANEIAASVTPINYAYQPGNVLRYGAYGDGTHDDTAAIQAALNCGRFVYLPAGTYKVSSSLQVKASGQRIYGDGRDGQSVISWSGSTNDTVIENSDTTVRLHVKMQDFDITFNSDGCTAIDIQHFSNATIQQLALTIYGNNTRGIYGIGRSSGDRPYYNKIDQVDIASNNIGGVTSGSVCYYFDRVLVSENYNGPNANRVSQGRCYGADYLARVLDSNGGNFDKVVGESIKVAHYDFGSSTADKSGTASSGTINTLVTSGLTSSVYNGGACKITGGTGSGQIRNIDSNNTTTVTVFPYWRVVPDATSTFELYINQGSGNVIRDPYCEGDAPSNPTFLRLRPGVAQTVLDGGTIGSLGTGVIINDECPRRDDRFTPNTWGPLVPITFYLLDLAASQTNLAIKPVGWTRDNLQTVFPWAIRAIDSNLSGVIVAGSAQISVTDNGTKINGATADVLLNSGNTTNANGGSQRNDLFGSNAIVSSGAGRALGLVVTTDGSWSPTNSDLHITLWMQRRT
jgi:hypothetical protein